MKIGITGSTGLIGSALVESLALDGHEIVPFVRSKELAGKGCIYWEPVGNKIESAKMEGLDGVIHLAGKNISQIRWNESVKAEIRNSRISGTRLIAKTLSSLKHPPVVFLSASSIGFYGNRGSENLSESSSTGEGFLADLSREWEEAALPAKERGIRTVNLRIGIVLSTKGGVLQKMLPAFKWGLGGVIGSGKQYMSWIAISDLIAAIKHLLISEKLEGPFNLTAPNPASNREFTMTLANVLHRPALFPLPACVIHLLFGEMGDLFLLGGAKVLPQKLLASSFSFEHQQLKEALVSVINKPS